MNATKTMPAADIPPMTFRVAAIKVRQPDGSILVKAGRPEAVEAEITIAEFHRESRVSKRYIAELCEQGHIQHRRLTPKKDSKILIPRSELERYLNLAAEASDHPIKTPATAVSATLVRLEATKSFLPPREARQIDFTKRSRT